MNIVQFGIKLKDMASGVLLKFGQTVKSTSATATASVSKTTDAIADTGRKAADTQKAVSKMTNTTAKGFDDIANSAQKAGQQIDRLKQKADKAAKGEGKKSTAGNAALDMFKGTAMYNGVIAAGSMAAEFFGGAIQSGLNRQKIQTSFNVLAGDESTGKELTKQLVDLQQSTILGAEVFDAAQMMMGFGFNALKDGENDTKSVIENLKMLGDVSMGDKEHLNGLALVYAQVCAAGKMNTQDLYQFINNGWNPLEQMSKSTGKSISKLKDEIAEGKITFDMVHDSLVQSTSEGGKFNNMLGEIAKTPFGKMQQLNGAWEEFKIKAGNAFTPLVSFALDLANKILPYLEKLLEPIGNGVGKVVGFIQSVKPVLVQAFSPVVAFVSDIIAKVSAFFSSMSEKANVFMQYIESVRNMIVEHWWPMLQKIVDFVGDLIASVVEFVSSSELIADLFSAIQSFISYTYDSVVHIIDALKWVFNNVIMPIFNGIERVYRFVKGMFSNTPEIPDAVKTSAEITLKKDDQLAKTTLSDKNENKSNAAVLNKIAENTKNNGSSSDKASKAVASSGPRVVNISLGKFFDNIVFNTTNLETSASEVQKVVQECLARVLLDGATN